MNLIKFFSKQRAKLVRKSQQSDLVVEFWLIYDITSNMALFEPFPAISERVAKLIAKEKIKQSCLDLTEHELVVYRVFDLNYNTLAVTKPLFQEVSENHDVVNF